MIINERTKRLIAVVTVKGKQAVQSFGYKRYLPMGNPKIIMENFDRWGADEIYLNCIDRGNLGPNLDLLSEISASGITTPVIYGGGIRSVRDAVQAIRNGADRVAIDAGWRSAPEEAASIHQFVGAQAVIASVPGRVKNSDFVSYNYEKQIDDALPQIMTIALQEGYISEVIVVDWSSEGMLTPFNVELLDCFPSVGSQLIAFGGICSPEIAAETLSHTKCVGVAIGNFLSYREHAIQNYKNSIQNHQVRKPQYYPFKTEKPIYAKDL